MLSALHWAFGITTWTPIKGLWVALTCLNVAMMLLLALRRGPPLFRAYMAVVAVSSVLQASPAWGLAGEIALALAGAAFVAEMLPEGSWERVFAISIGLMSIAAVMYASPHAWPKYAAPPFFARVYSTAIFLGLSVASAFDPWTHGDRVRKRPAIAVLWFLTTVLAGVNWDAAYWTVAVLAKASWTLCLLGWVTISGTASGRAVDAER